MHARSISVSGVSMRTSHYAVTTQGQESLQEGVRVFSGPFGPQKHARALVGFNCGLPALIRFKFITIGFVFAARVSRYHNVPWLQAFYDYHDG